jgi:3-hydroxyacyl-CoA dehydrogenase
MHNSVHVTKDRKTAFQNVQFIQECGPENYEIKQSIIKMLDENAPSDAIIASSTSGLLISEITKYSDHPERCVGAHPFNPPHLIPLVEITKSEKTTPETVDTVVAFYKKIGKEPVVLKKESLGFIANRIAHAAWREVMNMVLNGTCTLEDADKALLFGPGLRWAAFGSGILYDLGAGKEGLACRKFDAVLKLVFSDLSDMKEVPEKFHEIATEEIEKEKANLPEFIGHTNPEIAAFRDKVLIEVLKLHHKL